MARRTDVRQAGEQVERLLDELRANSGPRVAAVAEELVRTLVGLYGDGLARIVRLIGEGSPLLDELVADPLVEGLLLVHDLHPLDVDTRIQRALDRVRPYLGSHAGGVRYLGVDEAGVVQLELEGSCHGCPSSTVTVRLAIEQAVREAAPETVDVAVRGVVAAPAGAPLLKIGRRVPDAPVPAAPVALVDTDGWARLPYAPDTGTRTVNLGGVPVLVCQVDGTPYAYRDACPECGSSLAAGRLAGGVLRCPDCGRQYDARLAGAGLDDPARHLDPLPLLVDDSGIRVAVPAGAR